MEEEPEKSSFCCSIESEPSNCHQTQTENSLVTVNLHWETPHENN
jgi:hypothetical protein